VRCNERKKSEKSLEMSGSPLQAIRAVVRFSLSSLRGRAGQAIPVTLALLLIVGVAQAIGALHDVSSTLTRQQIAASWRASADLLVRPQAAVSQPERSAGWINSQGAFDDYGGISAKQVASIASLAGVTQILPFATVGWRRVDVVTPVILRQKGIYRITAQWTGAEQWAGNVVDYIEVSDLTSLTSEEPVLNLPVQHLILSANASPVVYSLSVPAVQLLVGVVPTQEHMLRSYLSEGDNKISSPRLTMRVDRLNGQLTMLPSCVAQSAQSSCWQSVPAQTGRVTYVAQDVQLLRYSQARYSATTQQLSQGQLSLAALGTDARGTIYRTLLPQHLTLAGDGASDPVMEAGQQAEVLPLAAPEHMPMLPGALQFLPLAQACAVNGQQCYSGLYIRLRGVDQYNAKSLALLQSTAATITARTGLHVDILDGSSTRYVTLATGNASSALTTTWRVVGVAVQITHGVDALQNTLFALCMLIGLLATGAAGILTGIGRRNEARALDQLGWSPSLRTGVYIFNALFLALPGCVLASLLIVLARRFWPGNVSFSTMWILLASGVIIYGISLICLAGVRSSRSSVGAGAVDDVGRGPLWPPASLFIVFKRWRITSHSGGRAAMKAPTTPHHPPPPLRTIRYGGAFHTRVTAPLVCGLAITATIFLIAIEYFMVSGLNRELVVTVLGNQVRVALAGAQVLLVALVVLTALLTVALCTSLLLRGRRDELALLAKVGWERRHVLLRLLKEGWRTGALSGTAGALLALGVIVMTGSLPPLLVVGSALAGGPLLGVMLASLVVYTLARRELSDVYLERA